MPFNNNKLAIVGGTGAVGIEILKCLEDINFPSENIKILASSRSSGKNIKFKNDLLKVHTLSENSFKGVDIALFSAGGEISKKYAPLAVEKGSVVVDNSSTFRLDKNVPLIIPEINKDDIKNHNGIIANPNCTTIITLMAIYPLHKAFGGVDKIIASSYQAVSGSGNSGIKELNNQINIINSGGRVSNYEVYPKQIAFNVIPHIDNFMNNLYTKEEMKLNYEGRKILNTDELLASITCVRVPVYRSHSVSITALFNDKLDLGKASIALNEFPGIKVMDEPFEEPPLYPTPLDSENGDDCIVGRIRESIVFDNAISLWIVGDQLRKGAALNAVQIAQLL